MRKKKIKSPKHKIHRHKKNRKLEVGLIIKVGTIITALLFLFSFLTTISLITRSSEERTNTESTAAGCGGTCINTNKQTCSGTLQRGLCPGGNNIVCCIAKGGTKSGGSSSSCSSKGGTCKNPKSCTGTVLNGLCSGGEDNKCCVPKTTTNPNINIPSPVSLGGIVPNTASVQTGTGSINTNTTTPNTTSPGGGILQMILNFFLQLPTFLINMFK